MAGKTVHFDLFDEQMPRLMADWSTPGCAVAIVKDGSILHWKGYGYRDIEKRLPIDLNTVFAIGSTSKAFTSATAAILVDEGLLDWDTPVKQYIPEFDLVDQLAAERMTVRDLLSHRGGLPRHDGVWYGTSFTRKEVFERLKYLQPSADFRTTYQYQNMMFMAAGYLIERITGQTWEEFTRRHILEPLGMSRTTLGIEGLRQTENVAVPYGVSNGENKSMPYRDLDVIAPAGGVNSCLADLAKWVCMQLEGGSLENHTIVSTENLFVTHTAHTNLEDNHNRLLLPFKEIGKEQYGLGWFIHDYRGRRLLRHGGHIDGFSTQISFMPEIGAGVIVLSNIGGSNFMFVPTFMAYDVLLDQPMVDWSARLRAEDAKTRQTGEDVTAWLAQQQIQRTAPSHAIADYASTYRHIAYGDVKISSENGSLKADFNTRAVQLKHFHYDTFEWSTGRPGVVPLKACFRTDWMGHLEGFSLQLEPMTEPLWFARQPELTLTDPAVLTGYTGCYVWNEQPVRVELMQGCLRLMMPGFPNMQLEAYQPDLFKVTGHAGWYVEFHGKPVEGFSLVQPSALFQVCKSRS